MTRNYDNYSAERAAAIIVSEVITEGESTGWVGNGSEPMETIEKICNKYNVYYVDDFHGTWEYRAK